MRSRRGRHGVYNGVGAHEDTAGLLVLVAGVLPGLGKHAVVPVDVVGVEPEGTLLHILLDWRPLLILRNMQRHLMREINTCIHAPRSCRGCVMGEPQGSTWSAAMPWTAPWVQGLEPQA